MCRGIYILYTIIPEVILARIGYVGEGPEAKLNWAVGRIQDLTPVKSSATEEYYKKAIEKAGPFMKSGEL